MFRRIAEFLFDAVLPALAVLALGLVAFLFVAALNGFEESTPTDPTSVVVTELDCPTEDSCTVRWDPEVRAYRVTEVTP